MDNLWIVIWIVIWLVVEPSLWKIWKSIRMIIPTFGGKIKNVPNHQPVNLRFWSSLWLFTWGKIPILEVAYSDLDRSPYLINQALLVWGLQYPCLPRFPKIWITQYFLASTRAILCHLDSRALPWLSWFTAVPFNLMMDLGASSWEPSLEAGIPMGYPLVIEKFAMQDLNSPCLNR